MPRRTLTAPTKKPVTLAAIHPNAGVCALYRRKLDRLIDEMHASLVYWISAAYRANPPEMAAPDLAQDDDSPAMGLRFDMRQLGNRWLSRFDKAGPELAKWFATAVKDRSDWALRDTLKRAGFTVEFKLTAAANDTLQATIGAQVGLIRSIATQHLTQVEGAVMRSVQAGRDLGSLAKELEATYGVTKRRAAFIARSQNNIATATITRVRQAELGIVTAKWLHSGGGRHPRPQHVAASGKTYDVGKGMFLEGVWTFPGVQPNCRCVSISIVPGLE
jgi:SPP1 gp7 family putative phage head morphogenesis protein